MNTPKRLWISILSLLSAPVVLTSCAVFESTGTQSSAAQNTAVASTVRDAASEVGETSGRLDVALNSLNNLINTPASDLRPQFRAFSENLTRLQSSATTMRSAADDMQSRGDAYFANWDAELARVQNEDIRSRSVERRREVAQAFTRVRESYTEARDRFSPLLATLQDIQTALSNDLTSAGIAAIRPLVAEVDDRARPLRESLTELSEEFRQLGVALAPENTPSSRS